VFLLRNIFKKSE